MPKQGSQREGAAEPRLGGWRPWGHFSPLDVAEHLRVAQEPAEVDVEHVPRGLEHDVVVVPVADPQHVGGHAAASAGVDEVFHSLGREGRSQQWRKGREGVASLQSGAQAAGILPGSSSPSHTHPPQGCASAASLPAAGL